MDTILIVEDDYNLRLLTKLNLTDDYKVIEAENGDVALEIIENNKIDLIVSDIMMPKLNGVDLVKELRENNILIPVIMLTAKSDSKTKYEGYDIGIDDYLTKPVDYNELKYKIKVLLKRTKTYNDKIVINSLEINKLNYSIKNATSSLTLPQKEFELLFLLMSNIDRTFTYKELLDKIWGVNSYSDETTVRTHVARLRQKISIFKEIEIKTIHSVGYKGVSYE